LRLLAQRSTQLGLVLHVAHLHHGLRGAEADGDLGFCRALAGKLALPFLEARADVAAEAEADPAAGKPAETLEEAARRLRYQWFRQLLCKDGLNAMLPQAEALDAVATAHTLDDQAETVLAKFLRGAWTEGLAGVHPVLDFPEGKIVRPFLSATRTEIEAFLRALGQDWREDSTNRHLAFTRNRIRHELLPLLEAWNPRLREHLSQMADLARDEEAWWAAELAQLAPQLILPGRPTRGGGRASGPGLHTGFSIEVARLASLAPALQRRLLRLAARQCGIALDFAATEALRALALNGHAGQKLPLAHGFHAERTPREIRLSDGLEAVPEGRGAGAPPSEYALAIPGEIDAPAFGLRLRIEISSAGKTGGRPDGAGSAHPTSGVLRNWRAGDRVRLRYSASPRKVKEVLERLRVTGSDRAFWPVLEANGRILWMRGVELEPEPGLSIFASFTGQAASAPSPVGGEAEMG
jgi:tRNA(Ile)-lysidine synthase